MAMSALLIDDLMVDEVTAGERAALGRGRGGDANSLASVTPLHISRQASPAAVWRLTDRGIAVVLSLFVGLFLTGVVVAVAGFLAISDAPLADDGTEVAAVSVFR